MSWNDFLRERESLNYGGEMYKKVVVRYLQTNGYSLKSTSTQEGHLADLIMQKPNNSDLWVETKDTSVSIFEKRFKRELLQYLCYWLILSDNKKFQFSIFAKNFKKKEETKQIISLHAEREKAVKWVLESYETILQDKYVKILEEHNSDEFYMFLSSIEVNLVTGYNLDLIARKREKELKKAPSYKVNVIYNEIKARRLPLQTKSKLLINFLGLDFPSEFWEFKSKFKRRGNLLNSFRNEDLRFPSFDFSAYESKYPIIRTFEQDISIFDKCFTEEPIKKRIEDLEETKLIWLLKSHLQSYMYCKGLKKNKNDYYFPYKNLSVIKIEDNKPLFVSGPKKPKEVTKVRFKEEAFNFVEHHGLHVDIGKIDDRFGIFIWPKFIFTIDGEIRITGDAAKRISQKYLNPLFNRNSNKRSELLFWEFYLTSMKFFREPFDWMKSFRLIPFIKEEFNWSSKSVPFGYHTLINFMDDDEDESKLYS